MEGPAPAVDDALHALTGAAGMIAGQQVQEVGNGHGGGGAACAAIDRPPVVATVDHHVVAEISDYQDLIDAMRGRALELKTTFVNLDDIAGIPEGYISKLTSARPVRRIGMKSLGDVLGALGVRLIMVVDPEAMRRVANRLADKRKSGYVRGPVREELKLTASPPKVPRRRKQSVRFEAGVPTRVLESVT